jgi:hypothetical protein
LNATRRKGGQPRLGLAGFDAFADLEPPLPEIRFDSRRNAVLDAFVNHGNSQSEVGEGRYFVSVFNPGNYGTMRAEPRCGLDAIALRRGRRRLPIGLGRVLLVGFMMANDASGDSADLAMPCEMAREAADDSTFDASLRLGGGARKGNAQNGGTDDERLHRGSPKNESLQ